MPVGNRRGASPSRRKRVTKKKKAPAPKDEYDDMTLEQLQEESKLLTQRVNEIRTDRNYYLLERDQVQQFYDVVRDEVTSLEAATRNVESAMERLQDDHRNEIRVYLQRVVTLEFEHATNVDVHNAEGEAQRGKEEAAHAQRKEGLNQAKLQLKSELRQAELDHKDEIEQFRENERKQMAKLKQEFETNHRELERKYTRRLQELRDDLELRRKMEVHEIEERKNRHITSLMANHEKAFKTMQNYYNAITRDNLSVIKTLNAEIDDLKQSQIRNKQMEAEIEAKNIPLQEELAKVREQVAALKKELMDHEKDKNSLKLALARLDVLRDKERTLRGEEQELAEAHQKMGQERDSLYKNFEGTVLGVQRRVQVKNEHLARVLDEQKDLFEVKKTQFTHVMRSSNLDPVVLQEVTKKLDNVLSSKNEQIEELRYEVAKTHKAHDDLVRVYEEKLRNLGIPAAELGLAPLVGKDALTNTTPVIRS